MVRGLSELIRVKEWQVKSVIDLVLEDNTVHFIARYRKEKTGDLDENIIRSVIEENDKYKGSAEQIGRKLKEIS